MFHGADPDLASTHLFDGENKGAYLANFTMTPTDVGKTKNGKMNLTSQMTACCEVHSKKPSDEVLRDLPLVGPLLRYIEDSMNASNQRNESIQSLLGQSPDQYFYTDKDDNITASLAEHSVNTGGVAHEQDASAFTADPRFGTFYFTYALRSEAPSDKEAVYGANQAP